MSVFSRTYQRFDIKNQKIWNSVNARLNQISQSGKKRRTNTQDSSHAADLDTADDAESPVVSDKPKPQAKAPQTPKAKAKKPNGGSANSTAPMQSFTKRASPYDNGDDEHQSGAPPQSKCPILIRLFQKTKLHKTVWLE